MTHREVAVITVVAGTPYDTRLGADLLRRRGFRAAEVPLASTPDEQDALQFGDPETLRAAYRDATEDAGLVMLFCNSLAAVVVPDPDDPAVVSPVTVYREVARRHRAPLVVAGNAMAASGYERAVTGSGALCVSDPTLVRAIEAASAQAAFERSALPGLLGAPLGRDAIVLACTHFTTVLPMVRASTTLPVVDVGSRLVDLAVAAAAGRSAA